MLDYFTSPIEFGASTLMMYLFFGSNLTLFLLFHSIKVWNNERKNDEIEGNKSMIVEKKLSKPFLGSLDCFTNLTSELAKTGFIMAVTFICEKHWIYEHSSKSYSRDLFLFILIIFFGYAFYTIKPITDLSLLGREQTEEWKGWMQFIFLLYHYFHAEEVYNSVRVMITCYVWMTGFGNFSFFYIKRDFSWLRVAQMLWRLNFSVLLLMWTHGNTYILYYICPLHTFYFLMVYVTMYCYQSLNHTKWGIRWKLLVLGVLIYIVWDINGGLFDILFSWLGTDKVIGANSGSVWEYYFRTSLDHYSTYYGMIFALNFPVAEQFFTRGKGLPLIITGIILLFMTIWWFTHCYSLPKMSYNMSHAYYSFIPMLSYIFFRNVTPWIRSFVSMSLHDLGKTTLETYLLQHHIWLTSNAKTLLTIIPDYPWINFALASILFMIMSKELYRLTMSLRGMILPDDKRIAWNNLIGMIIIIGSFYIIAHVFILFTPSLLEVITVSMGIALTFGIVISMMTHNFGDHFAFKFWSRRFLLLIGAAMGLCLVMQMSSTRTSEEIMITSLTHPEEASIIKTEKQCMEAITSGHWMETKCDDVASNELSHFAYCMKNEWVWDDYNCPIGKSSTEKLRSVYANKPVVFVGDSQVRQVYHSFIRQLDPFYEAEYHAERKHEDLSHKVTANIAVQFKWAPFVNNITMVMPSLLQSNQIIVAGAASWDALHHRNITDYSHQLSTFTNNIKKMIEEKKTTTLIWLQPTTVHTNRLTTDEKRKFMNEVRIKEYRNVFKSSNASKMFHTIIDPSQLTLPKVADATDGIHFRDDVYDVIAQMVINGHMMHMPGTTAAESTTRPAPYTPKVTGSMSFPAYGLLVLLGAVLMLFLMDSFFGIGSMSLILCGGSLDWDAAYIPLHRKILGNASTSTTVATTVAVDVGNNAGNSNDPETGKGTD